MPVPCCVLSSRNHERDQHPVPDLARGKDMPERWVVGMAGRDDRTGLGRLLPREATYSDLAVRFTWHSRQTSSGGAADLCLRPRSRVLGQLGEQRRPNISMFLTNVSSTSARARTGS